MEDDTEQKQNFLKENILDAGYDVDEFVALLQSVKGEQAADVDLWTFDELKNIVNQFIKSQNEITQAQNNVTEGKKNSVKDEDILLTGAKSTEGIYDDNNIKIEENFEKIIKCEKLGETEFAKLNKIEVRLLSPEKNNGGFFSKAYITYLVSTEPLGYKVRRRYSDFEWLKSVLTVIFPGYMIPPISKKNYGDRFNEVFISKRMRYLDLFMESITQNTELKNSQVLYDFLTIDKEIDFNNKKKEYSKLKAPTKLSQIVNIEGELKCKVSKESQVVTDNIKNYLNVNEVLLKKLSTANKNLYLEMNQVSLRMKEISEIYNQLYYVSNKSNDNPTVIDTYRMLSKLMNDWGEAEKKQSMLINIELKEYFRYIKNEFVEFKDLLVKTEMSKNAYSKADSKLSYKKEEYFKSGLVQKWEIQPEDMNKLDKNELIRNKEMAYMYMLPKETQHVQLLKENYGYYSCQIHSEFDRLRSLNGIRHQDHVTRVSQNHSDILADLHVMWADLLSYYSEVYDSNTKKENI